MTFVGVFSIGCKVSLGCYWYCGHYSSAGIRSQRCGNCRAPLIGSCLLPVRTSDCKSQETHQFAEVAELKMTFGRWHSTGLIAHMLRVNRNKLTFGENICLVMAPYQNSWALCCHSLCAWSPLAVQIEMDCNLSFEHLVIFFLLNLCAAW